MTLEQVKVSENIRLSCIQTDKFKTGILTFTILLPTNKENTIYNMILPGVLRRGTERYPDMASINRRLDELYASCVEIRTGRIGRNLALILTAELLDECYSLDDTAILDGVLEILSQMLLHPKMTDSRFDAAIVEQEKGFERDALRATVNNTRSYAAIRLSELMYREDDTTPTLKEREAGIQGVTASSLSAYYHRLLQKASLDVFYVGTVAPQKLAEKIHTYFSEWRASPITPILMPRAERSSGYYTLTEQMPVSQGKLAMGFRTGVATNVSRDDCYTAMVFNEIFGGSPASKLFMNVREKMSLCYYCSSAYSQYSGTVTVSSGIDSKNREIAERAILEQLRQIQQGDISDTEFHAAKISLENAYRQIYDNPFDLQTFYGNRTLFGIPGDIDACRRKIAAVTKEQVIELAQQVFCDTVFFVEGVLKQNAGKEEWEDD